MTIITHTLHYPNGARIESSDIDALDHLARNLPNNSLSRFITPTETGRSQSAQPNTAAPPKREIDVHVRHYDLQTKAVKEGVVKVPLKTGEEPTADAIRAALLPEDAEPVEAPAVPDDDRIVQITTGRAGRPHEIDSSQGIALTYMLENKFDCIPMLRLLAHRFPKRVTERELKRCYTQAYGADETKKPYNDRTWNGLTRRCHDHHFEPEEFMVWHRGARGRSATATKLLVSLLKRHDKRGPARRAKVKA